MLRKLLLTGIFFLSFSLYAFAQSGSITGTVTDAETGEPVISANIFIASLERGAATNADGEFTLTNLEPGNYSLRITYVGYNTLNREVEVGSGETTVNIQLKPALIGLDDVVVTALGIEREKRALGYGVSEISGDDLETNTSTDLARSLGGELPGVKIDQSGGLTGSGTDITIRGLSSISGNNNPLIIVDGVRFDGGNNENSTAFAGGGTQTTPNRLLDINQNNIQNVTVLKGLSATVLYGEEGRNGVILVETKSGSFQDREEPGFEVTLNQSVFASQISSRPDYQNEYGGGFDQNFGWFFSNWGPRFDSDNATIFGENFIGFDDDGTVLIEHPLNQHGPTAAAFPELSSQPYRFEARPDPIDAFFGTGLSSNSSINIAGGTSEVQVNVNYARTDEEGFTPNNGLERDAFGLGARYQIFDNLSAQTTFNFSLTDVTSPPSAAGGGSGPAAAGGTTGVFADVFYTPRSIDLSIPHQNPVTGGSAYYRAGNGIPHPRWTANNVRTSNNTNRYFGKTELNFQPMDGFNLQYKLGYDSYTENQTFSQNPGGVRPEELLTGFFQTIDINRTAWDHQFNALFDFDLTEDFSFDATVGAQYVNENFQRQGVESQNMIIFDFFEHSNFTDQSPTNFFNGTDFQREVNEETAGVFADLSLGYQDFVYLNLAGRNDWFSTLEPENRRIFYPSASLSYIISDHLDFQSDAISFVKLFAGVGTSAGSPSPYSTRNVLSTTARAFVQNGGALITTNATSDFLGNPDLQPELHTEYELGVDTRFLNNKLGLNISGYTKSTTDLITNAPLDPATGFTSTLVNIGEVQNRGLEISLNGTPVSGDFRWDIRSNFFTNESEVKELGAGLDRIQVGGGFTTRGNFAIEGEPFLVMLGSQIERVTQELIDSDPAFSGVAVGTPLVGSTGNYIESDDIGIIGDPNPDWEMSLSNTFRYKGAALSFQFDYQQGGDMFSTWISTLLARGLTTTTTEVDRNNTFILPGVNEQGETNQVQISPSGVFFDNFGFGADELRVYDMTHLRLSNVSLSYDLPPSLIGRTPLSQVTFSVNGNNLWLFAFNVPDGSGFDPAVNSIGGNSRGFEYLTGPQVRRFGGSVQIRF